MVKEYCIKNEVNFKDLKPLLEKTIEASSYWYTLAFLFLYKF